MIFRAILTGLLLALTLSCSDDAGAAQKDLIEAAGGTSGKSKTVSYHRDISPILESKCIACHSCYDSPCQLNLTSQEGLIRGANKRPVYDSTRLTAASPTRMFIDGQSEQDWRKHDFYSVIEESKNSASLLYNMLALGQNQSFDDNKRITKNLDINSKRNNICPAPDEFARYAKNNPAGGMPFGVSGLSKKEFSTVESWLQQGAKIDRKKNQLDAALQREITQWETFFNAPNKRQQLVSRYLYEHLFIAHLYFRDVEPLKFFRLVRSYTPPGQAIKPVATQRPNRDPGQAFWYRLMPIEEVIVYKTHITYALDEQRMARLNELFLETDWNIDQLPGYSDAERRNPFNTFNAIPARSRYQFMLDDAAYFVRTFIRGPVCHGQIATDVIRDRFWNLFQSPDSDLFITNSAYRNEVTGLLALPGINDELDELLSQWLDYRGRNKEYLKKRQAAYAKHYPQGPGLKDIWDGDGDKTDALQTIFRHHNSAGIEVGLIGETPKTIWVMDYALFERSFYVLVGNFDVFGTLAHQTLTRLYFDLIRNGSEQNFLRFLPADRRQQLIDDWYQGTAQLKLFLTYDEVERKTGTRVPYRSKNPESEFGRLVKKTMPAISYNSPEDYFSTHSEKYLMPLTRLTAAQLPFIKLMPDVSFLRIEDEDNQRQVYSILRDREHSNVAFMLAEELRYQTDLDRLTIYPGILSSYPNFIFDVSLKDLPAFTQSLKQVNNRQAFRALTSRWGIRRSHPDFWPIFHDFTEYVKETNPVEAGVFDMNRYENL